MFPIEKIQQTREIILPHIRKTPLWLSGSLTDEFGVPVYVKYELFQRTGSFKVRGAFNKLLSLNDEEKARGVVTVSGGNHAQAVAFASSKLALDAIVIMPENTPTNYIEATRSYGAKIELVPTIADAFQSAENHRKAGRIFVHPFDDPLVILGQGTLGLEIMEDLPETTDLFVSIGGGGLMTGVASAVKALNPQIRIWGVETEGADAMKKALQAGEPVTLPAITSIAKTLGAPAVSETTLKAAQNYLEDLIVVTDSEAIQALSFILERLKTLSEPAASCTLAAAWRLKSGFNPDSKIVLILCGGNYSASDFCQHRSQFIQF
jgi:threonine dehydratase